MQEEQPPTETQEEQPPTENALDNLASAAAAALLPGGEQAEQPPEETPTETQAEQPPPEETPTETPEEQPPEETPTETPAEQPPDETPTETPAEQQPAENPLEALTSQTSALLGTQAEEQPPAEQPQEEQQPAEQPQEEQPPAEQPQEEQPPAEQPQEEQPQEEQPPAEQPPAEQPQEEQPQEEQPPAEQPQEEQPPAEQPQEEQPQEEQPPTETNPEGEQPAENPLSELAGETAALLGGQPAEEPPAEEKVAEETPAEEKAAEENPEEEKAAEETPVEEQANEEQNALAELSAKASNLLGEPKEGEQEGETDQTNQDETQEEGQTETKEINGEDNIQNETADNEHQEELNESLSRTAAGMLGGLLGNPDNNEEEQHVEEAESENQEEHINIDKQLVEEEEEHETGKLDEQLGLLGNLLDQQTPENAREYVYVEEPVSIPQGLDIHEQYNLNHVIELQILPDQEEYTRCLFSATQDTNVFSNYCRYLKCSNVATFHFSKNQNDEKIDNFFSFCTGKELIGIVNPTPEQIEVAIKSLRNSYVIPCSLEDKEELRQYENIPPIRRYASKAMINYVNKQIAKQKEQFELTQIEYDNPSTYSSFLNICIDSYLGYLASFSADECEGELEPGHEYTYNHEKCSIFNNDFDTSDLLGINNVREIELAPNHYVRCVFSSTEDNVLEQYLSFMLLRRAISYHFSASPNGRVNFLSLCTGSDLVVLVNPSQDQLNMVINKIKHLYVIPCGQNDKNQLFFYDYLNRINNIASDSEVPQILEEINQVKSSGYPRKFVYDVASSYEKFLFIAYTTFLGYYIRSQFLEPDVHPVEFKVYNFKDFIPLRSLNYGKTLALNWAEGKVYVLKKYLDESKFNQSQYLYKTKRMSCVVPFYGEARNGENYLIFGYGSRGTLREAAENHLDVETCRKITIELAFGLAYLHMTGSKPCSVTPDHVSICWDYHVHLTDFDEQEKVINCTPEQIDATNLGIVLHTLTTGESISALSLSSKSIPSSYGPVSNVFELCKKPDVTICDIVSEILNDKGFSQESDLIYRLLQELPHNFDSFNVVDNWYVNYFRRDCSVLGDSTINFIKTLKFGPVTTFHFIKNEDEQNQESDRTLVFETNNTCGTLTKVQPNIVNIVAAKMRNSLVTPVTDEDLDTLFEYYNFDLIQNFMRDPLLSSLREEGEKAVVNFNPFEDKNLTKDTLALSYAIANQPKPQEEESSEQPLQLPQVSLLNPRFNLQTQMPNDEVKEIEVFNDFVVKCLYSTAGDYTYNEFAKEFGNDKFVVVHFSNDENTNKEYVSFCTSKQLLLLPTTKMVKNEQTNTDEEVTNPQVNATINHIKDIKVFCVGSEDRTSLFGFTNFDKIQSFANESENDDLKQKVEKATEELLPHELSFDEQMTYSTYFKHAGDAVTGYYVLLNPNYEVPNPIERIIDALIPGGEGGGGEEEAGSGNSQPGFDDEVDTDEKRAFQLYQEAAKRDDPAALFNIGLMYSRGQGVPKDKAKAAEYYEKAAARGNPKAQFNLGLMYAKGEGVPEDKVRAAQLYEQAANQGNAKAQSNLALMYSRGEGVEQDFDKAVELYEKAAEQNDADAQLNLGLMYDQGEGVPVDKERAVELYTKSANNGNPKAQFNLGVMYHKGEPGVLEKDNQKAVELYTKAAEKGVAQAQFNLGVLYSKGDTDIPQDKERAVELFTQAAEQNDADAQLNLGAMYAKGEGVPEVDKTKTVELYKKAAKQNNPKAQFNLGVMYSKGDGVDKNPKKAAKYYQKAADQDIPQALFNLGVLYFKGAEGVPEDKAKAAELFERAAELNPKNTKALFNLAVMYQKGEGVEKDEEKALELYERASELNNRDALLNLGVMYSEGSGGVDQDKEKALEYYQRAADLGNAKAQLNLGLMYQRGDGCDVDLAKARKYFQMAADQGNAQAQLNLGLLYLGGDEGEQEKAIKALKEAADKGNVDAMIELARRYEQDENMPLAMKYYSEAANKGNPQGQLGLGKIYLNGVGDVDEDLDKAEQFLQESANGGCNEALLYLGDLYAKRGEDDKAKEFYQNAFDLGVEGANEKLNPNHDSISEVYDDKEHHVSEKNVSDQIPKQIESDHPDDDTKADESNDNNEIPVQEEEEVNEPEHHESEHNEPEHHESEPHEPEHHESEHNEPEHNESEPHEPETREPEEEEPEPEPEKENIDKLYESLEERIKVLHDLYNEPYNGFDSALNHIDDLFVNRALADCLETYQNTNAQLRSTEDDVDGLVNAIKENINNSSLPSLRRDSKGHISMNLPNGFLPLEGISDSAASFSSGTIYSDDEELSRIKSDVSKLESQLNQLDQQIENSRAAVHSNSTRPRIAAPRASGSQLSSGRNSASGSGTEFVSLINEPDTPRRAPPKKVYQPPTDSLNTSSPRNCPSPRTARNKIKNLLSKAENGDAKAQYSLGACYALGEGVAQDKKKALEYYLMAANQGDRNAQFAAAACYSYGKGTEQDKNRAFELYLQAAVQGHDKAQFAVGHFYEYGQGGVEQDHDKAVEWYKKAAAQGHQAAIDALRSESEDGPAALRSYSSNNEEEAA